MSKDMKQFRRNIEDIEAGASYHAAEVLLIGLKHIKEHRMSYPLDTTKEEWFDEIVPELIWFCEFERDGLFLSPEELPRYKRAQELLGLHFCDIWC